MFKKNFIIVCLIVLALAGSASARVYYSDGGVHNLTTQTTESLGVTDGTTINIGDGVTLTLTRESTYSTSYIGVGAGEAYLNISGSGQMLFAQEMALTGSDGTGASIIDMSGTSYANPASLYVGMRGDSVLNLTDDAVLEIRSDGTLYTPSILHGNQHYGYDLTGTINQSGDSILRSLGSGMDMGANNTAIYNMSGGLLELGDAITGPGADDEFNFSEGTIKMAGDHTPWASARTDWFNVLGSPYSETFDGTDTILYIPGCTIVGTIVELDDPMEVEEGDVNGSAVGFSVALDNAPGATDTITVDIDPDSNGNGVDLTVNPTQLTFTLADWNVPQTVTVKAIDDTVDEGSEIDEIGFTVTSAESDPCYAQACFTSVGVTILDDDHFEVVIAETGGETSVSVIGPILDTYTVVLYSQPTNSVTITADPVDTQLKLNGSSAGAAVDLTFTTANWDTAQTVTVEVAVQDYSGISTAIIEHSSASSDPSYNGLADNDLRDVSVTVIDPSNGAYGDFVVYGFWGGDPFIMEKVSHLHIGWNGFDADGNITNAASGYIDSADYCHQYGVKAIVGMDTHYPWGEMMDNGDGSRDNFVSQLTQFLIDSGADGVDFDREDFHDSNYDLLVIDCKTAFAPYNFTVGADVYTRGALASSGLGAIDHLNLMAYCNLSWDIGMIEYWQNRGATDSTIMVGIADGWAGGCDYDDYGYSQAVAVEKTQYAIDNGLGGVMIFRTDLDTMDPATSLLQAIRDTVINHYQCNICQPPSTGDLNDDKMVTVDDFAMIAEDFEIGNADMSDLHEFFNYWLFDSGLIKYFKFDEASGSAAASSAGCGCNGTLVNMDDSDWVPAVDRPGNALDFDGLNDHVQITGYKGVTSQNSRTVAAWIKTSTTGEIVTWGTNSPSEKWVFRVQDGAGQLGAIRVEVSAGYIVGKTDLRDNLWHHVAAVLENDGSPDVTEVKLYVDGVEDSPYSSSGPEPIDTAVGDDVKIGIFTGSGREFDGLIDDVRIYSRPLSASEIYDLAN